MADCFIIIAGIPIGPVAPVIPVAPVSPFNPSYPSSPFGPVKPENTIHEVALVPIISFPYGVLHKYDLLYWVNPFDTYTKVPDADIPEL